METKIKSTYKFSEIDYSILKKIANYKFITDQTIFNDWFTYKYKLNEEENKFLLKLINTNKYHLKFYSERQLQAQFMVPLLFKVNFVTDEYRTWYEYNLTGIVNNYKLTGNPDFMIASGDSEP